uniref:Uncharacterized protein n=1 Tax=Geladintestivirus 2 TaxID=3233134 RepID=A0AAU8MGQ0_9CAUD
METNKTNNKTEVKNSEIFNKTNKLSKMKKTELLDIIFRKDDVEKNLRKEIVTVTSELNKVKSVSENTKKEYDSLMSDINELNEDYKNVCDELMSIKCMYRTSKCKYRKLNEINIILLIVSGIMALLLLWEFLF